MDFHGGGGDYYPRAILPTEMWFNILKKLEDHPDPRDLIDSSETCTLFSDILSPKTNAFRLAEVMPLVLQWLEHQDRLNCRCLSKRVTRSVDSILDEVARLAPNQHLNLYKGRFVPPRIPPNFESAHFLSLHNSIAVRWDTRAQLERFHREMTTANLVSGGHHPMIGQTLHLRPYFELITDPPGNADDGRNCLARSIQLLPEYSNAIRHLTLDSIHLTGSLIETYDIHRRILTALPNLCCFHHYQLGDVFSRVGDAVRELGRHILENPLPLMRYLEDISFRNMLHPVPVPVVQEICARYGAQLKRLRMTQPADRQESGDVQALVRFPTLTHLYLSNGDIHDRDRSPPIILMNVQAENLVGLCLSIDISETSTVLPALVQYLASFPRLISLSLRMTCVLLHGVQSGVILAGVQCPSVKTLKIRTRASQLPLAFFTKLFPNLESLHLRENNVGVDLEAGEFQRDLDLLKDQRGFECGVWEACPSLKILRFYSGSERMDILYKREAYRNGVGELRIQLEMEFEDDEEDAEVEALEEEEDDDEENAAEVQDEGNAEEDDDNADGEDEEDAEEGDEMNEEDAEEGDEVNEEEEEDENEEEEEDENEEEEEDENEEEEEDEGNEEEEDEGNEEEEEDGSGEEEDEENEEEEENEEDDGEAGDEVNPDKNEDDN